MSGTTFIDKVVILADLWMYHRDEEEFEDLFEYADLGLPLAYARSNDIVDLKPRAVDLVNEAFDMLLSTLGIEEDAGYENLDEMLGLEDYEIPIVYINEDGEEEEGEPGDDLYDVGYKSGAAAEQKRVQEVIAMHKRWAKEKNRASEYMFWDSAGEVLTPIDFEYDEEEYRKSLEADGF